MLDDKNETIESLKLEIESAQKDQEGRIDISEYEKLNVKYRKNKDKLKSPEKKVFSLEEIGFFLGYLSKDQMRLEQISSHDKYTQTNNIRCKKKRN